MKIALNGSNGFVGKYLTNFLTTKGYKTHLIPREIYHDAEKLKTFLEGCDGVINLAGASISKKWTTAYKKIMYESRIETTKSLVDAINSLEKSPSFFISTSAVGIYQTNKEHTETSNELDNSFLGKLAQNWENEALKISSKTTQISIFRFGVVLGDGGAISEMLPIFKAGLGGVLGNGQQGFSWIHIEDLARAYHFVIKNALHGTFNLTSPNPITNTELTRALGLILGRPTLFKVPPFALKLKFGEGASILLDGQKVYPQALLEQSFTFSYPTIQEALKAIINPKP